MDLLSCAHIQLVVYIPTMLNRCIEKTCSQIPIMLLEAISWSYLHFLRHVQPTHSPNPLLKCSLLCIALILQNSQNKHHILSRLHAHRSFWFTPLQTPTFRSWSSTPTKQRTSVLPNQPRRAELFQREELKAQNFKFKHQSHLGELGRGEHVSVDAADEKIAVFCF